MFSSIKYSSLPFAALFAVFSVTAAQLPAGKTVEKITIDGKLEESVWKNTSGALLFNQQKDGKEIEPTQFFVCFDAKYLYVSGVVTQSHLDPVVNKLDSVEAKGVADNSPAIYNDDCIELFWQVPGDDHYYHLAFNQIGRKIMEYAADYGLGKELPVKDIVLKTHQEQRSWSFEAAIPLALLGNSADGVKFNFFRNNSAKGEMSAWSPSKVNFHDTAAFGTLKFVDESCLVLPTRAGTKDGVLELALRLGKGDYRITGTLGGEIEVKAKNKQLISLQGVADVNSGMAEVAVYNLADDKLLWSTPALSLGGALAQIELDLTIPAAGTLYVNGERNAEGGRFQKTVNLSGTNNTIAFTFDAIDKTLVTGTIRVGEVTVDAAELLYSAKGGENWQSVDFDDSDWKAASQVTVAPGKRFYRYNIIRNFSVFAPQRPDKELFLCNNEFDQLTLRISSPKATDARQYQVNFIVPSELTIPRYDFNRRSYNRYSHQLVKEAADGRQTWQFLFDSPMPQLAYNWGYNVINFVVRPEFPVEAVGKSFSANVYQKGRGFVEYPQTLALTILPPLAGKMPERIVFDFWEMERGNCFSIEEMKLMMETFRHAGVNYGGILSTRDRNGDDAVQAHFKALGMKTVLNHFGYCSTFLNSRPATLPPIPHINPVHARPNWSPGVCPEAFITDAWIRDYLSRAARNSDIVVDDMESGIRNLCFCEKNCLPRIMKFLKLTAPVPVEELYRKHEESLIAYNLELNERLIRAQRDILKTANPAVKFGIYSGYDSAAAPKSYGVEWHRYKGLLDWPMAGYDINPAIIGKTRAVLGNQPIVCGYILDSNHYEKELQHQDILAALFQQLKSGGFGGVLVWMYRDLDGRGWRAMAEFSRGVAMFESFLLEEKQFPCATPGVTLYKDGGRYLYLAINPSGQGKEYRLTLPRGMTQAKAWDFYPDKKFTVSKNFTINVPAYSVGLIQIEESL